MGKFKDKGDPAAALAEECAEVIQVIAKAIRFGDWNMIPPSAEGAERELRTRRQMLDDEMKDVIYQYERLKTQLDEQKIVPITVI